MQSDIKEQLEGKVLRDARIVLNREIDPTEKESILKDQNVINVLFSMFKNFYRTN